MQGTVRLGMTKQLFLSEGYLANHSPPYGGGVRGWGQLLSLHSTPLPMGEGLGEGPVVTSWGQFPLLRIPWILLQLRIIRDIPLWDRQISVEGLERTVLNLAATTYYGTHGWVGN